MKDQIWRRNVLECAIKGYGKMWTAEVTGTGHVNRPSHVTFEKRRAARLVGSSTWFQKEKETNEESPKTWTKRRRHKPATQPAAKKIESILFVPYTPGSRLKKLLQEAEDRLSRGRSTCRVRFIERAGPKIADLLSNKHPWAKESCDKPHCLPCKSKPGSCRASSICYRIKCESCSQKGVKAQYIAESKR